MGNMGSSRRPVVKVIKVEGGHLAECHTQGCWNTATAWTSGPHVVKAAAEEQARWHREQHKTGAVR